MKLYLAHNLLDIPHMLVYLFIYLFIYLDTYLFIYLLIYVFILILLYYGHFLRLRILLFYSFQHRNSYVIKNKTLFQNK